MSLYDRRKVLLKSLLQLRGTVEKKTLVVQNKADERLGFQTRKCHLHGRDLSKLDEPRWKAFELASGLLSVHAESGSADL